MYLTFRSISASLGTESRGSTRSSGFPPPLLSLLILLSSTLTSFARGLLCGVSQQHQIHIFISFFIPRESASFPQKFQDRFEFACLAAHVHLLLMQPLRLGEVVFSLARAGSQPSP